MSEQKNLGPSASPINLRQKLAAIRDEIHNIEKRGRNDFHKYDYVMASDVAGTIGNALAQANIAFARRNLQVNRSIADTPKGGKETVVELTCDYGFLDGDSGEELWMPAYGEGRDSGDKAAYKAFTGALKYFLVQAFLLATGDDPEADEEPTPKHEPARPKNDPLIETGEAEDLSKKIIAAAVDPSRVLTFFKKEAFEHFTKSEYARALKMLTERGKK